MSTFAAGKHAYGFCDRCGFRCDLNDLKYEMTDQRRNGLRVCPECLDIDHEQLQLGKFRIYDPEALNDPRPDVSQSIARGIFGWSPVGDGISMKGTGKVGAVTISTS